MPHTLYMVATPIGNLADWSERARTVVLRVNAVFAEDTRVAMRLLRACGIQASVERYDHHSHARTWPRVLRALQEGDVAYVSDAGTPGVEDPGGRLVAAAIEAGFVVSPIPGPSAIMAALSVSGFPAERFVSFGFPPKRKGRQTFFDTVAATEGTTVLYESVHRIEKTLWRNCPASTHAPHPACARTHKDARATVPRYGGKRSWSSYNVYAKRRIHDRVRMRV